MKNVVKGLAKRVMRINTTITKSSFKEKNFCKSLSELIKSNKALLSSNSHVGKRKDGKKFYYDISKIADGFEFINNELNKYGDENVPNINEYDGFHSGTPMNTKPFPLCINNVKKLLRKKDLYTYQSTTGNVFEKEKIVNYLSREGFKINSDKNYDGIGVDNIVSKTWEKKINSIPSSSDVSSSQNDLDIPPFLRKNRNKNL